MSTTRRDFMALAGAGLVLAPSGRLWAQTGTMVGDWTVDSVSDGHLSLPRGFYFDGLPEAELAPILAEHGLSGEMIASPCNVTVARRGGDVVLFDCGAGPAFMDSAGRLLDGLETLDIAPEDVTHVVFTHGHPDHLWGVLDDFDDPVFTEARYLMGGAEWNYWRDPATVDSIGEARASFAVGAARRLELVEERITAVADGEEILPGLMALASHGHTPGHMSFVLRGEGAALLVAGDAIVNGHVAFERPGWELGSDQDPALAAVTRLRLLDMLASEEMRLIGFHLPEGGLGRVERRGEAYRFVPEAA
ncbi:MBL fold metallo-hydrolase [Roseovarius sp. C7]|uniref:MBL fold metallo-hydrolase n=1 Tax=Roseovarius sp. C7 TaxID=3398643 RepID=UPI0039F72E1C